MFSSAVAASALAHAALAAAALVIGAALERPPLPSSKVLEVALVGPLLDAVAQAPAATSPPPAPAPPAVAPEPAPAKPRPAAAPARIVSPPPRALSRVKRDPTPPPRPAPDAALASAAPASRALPAAAGAATTAALVPPRAAAPRGLVTARPRYKRNPEPPYPLDARRRRQEGTVLLSVHVTAAGAPRAVTIARSSGFRALDDAAASAVARWEFEPGRRDGEPVASAVEIPVRFQLR